jgi:hypothetical protein
MDEPGVRCDEGGACGLRPERGGEPILNEMKMQRFWFLVANAEVAQRPTVKGER